MLMLFLIPLYMFSSVYSKKYSTPRAARKHRRLLRKYQIGWLLLILFLLPFDSTFIFLIDYISLRLYSAEFVVLHV